VLVLLDHSLWPTDCGCAGSRFSPLASGTVECSMTWDFVALISAI
jgi:hypothetical protein